MSKKNKLFNFFTPKSITKDDEFAEIPTNFKGFFVMLGRKFWNISNLSLLFSVANFPIFAIFLGFSMQTKRMAILSPEFAEFFGMFGDSISPEASSVFSSVGSFGVKTVPSVASWICFGIGLLLLITFGLSSAGAAYCIRGYNRGDPIFLISDFFYTIKKNWKQALIVGILDIVFMVVLVFDYMFWYSKPGFIEGILMYFALFLCVLYFFMRYYIYTILITFDLSVYKIFKDAFLLAFLGFKRNIMAFLGILIVVFFNFFISTVILSVGIMLPIVITSALCMFIAGYASYPVIKKFMIDPFYPDADKPADDIGEDDEPVFEDRG